MTELAVALPLLLVTTIGLVDFGRAAYEAIEIENAAHAGASYAARNPAAAQDIVGIEMAALADMGDADTKGLTIDSERFCECASGTSVDCDSQCAGVQPFMYVRVRVDKQFATLLHYPGLKDTIDLAREVQMRVR